MLYSITMHHDAPRMASPFRACVISAQVVPPSTETSSPPEPSPDVTAHTSCMYMHQEGHVMLLVERSHGPHLLHAMHQGRVEGIKVLVRSVPDACLH